MAKSDKHEQLQDVAIGWLYGRGCSVFGKEIPTWNGIADAVGVVTNQRRYGKEDTSYYIEAKVSRSDLLCLKQRSCYRRVEDVVKEGIYKESMFGGQSSYDYPNDIDFFYFIIADGLTIESDLYPLWGVIDERGKVIRRATRIKKNKNTYDLITDIAHVLIYKVFGKMYAPVS